MPDFTACNLYIDCVNNSELSIDQLFIALVKEDGNGCPAINVVTNGGGGVPAGIATEATLQLLLGEMIKDFDFELKCVRDTNTGVVYIMRIQKDENTGAITIDYIDATGAVIVPPVLGNLVVCDANTALMLILAEIQDQYTGDVVLGTSDISGVNPVNIATSTFNSMQLIVVTGTVIRGAIAYPAGVYNITAPLNKTLPAIVLDASSATEAYLETMQP